MTEEMKEVGEVRRNSTGKSLVMVMSFRYTLGQPCYVSVQSVDKVICGEFEYAKIYQKRGKVT